MTYGTVIKQAREARRLTQEQLAEKLDISRQAVSKWEADLSRPTREKLDRLSEILDIPPKTWAEIDAEAAAAAQPPDTSRPWKIATAVLAAACVVLAICLTIALWLKANVDVPRPAEDQRGQEPSGEEPSPDDIQVIPLPDEESSAPTDPSEIFPDVLPLTVRRDFDFGDQPLGEYDLALVPFLDNLEELQENTLAGAVFGDTANHQPGDSVAFLDIVKANTHTDDRGTAFSDVYFLYRLSGDPDYRIMLRAAEENHYVNSDPNAVTVEPFFNVLGHDGFRISIVVGASGCLEFYITQRPDGTPCMMTTSSRSILADIDEDGVLEIIEPWKNAPTWDITDTRAGEEGSFTYTLSTQSEEFPGALALGLDPEKGGFVVVSSEDTVLAHYALRDGEMVRLPLTDFSALDYPDVAGAKITFITDYGQIGVLTDGLDPDAILPYTDTVRVTHRQQAYLALQELYNLTGIKVDECYCAANEFGVLFSLLPDGFNQRSFLHFDFNTRYGNADNIPSIVIGWKELGCDWSPLSIADAVRPESWVEGEAETMLWYYNRMKIFSTGDASYTNGGEMWLENRDLYLYFMEETEYGPVLTGVTGPYPDGVVNH